MAFNSANLHLQPGAPGDFIYKYDAGSDTLAQVIAAGYFNNTDDSINLVVDDVIYVDAADGNMMLKVASISSGAVTTQFAGGDLPVNSSVGTASGAISVGYTEKDSGSASAHVLPAPYAGARVTVFKTGTATSGQTFVTDATTTTLNPQGDRTIQLNYEGEGFTLRGSSTSRWRIEQFVSFSSAGGAQLS